MKLPGIARQRPTSDVPARRWGPLNTMNFPRELRAAIPTLSRCWGRSLLLSSITGRAFNQPFLGGPRVRVKFQVEETGKLTGQFDVWLDVDPDAARGLARTLNQLADEAAKIPPAAASCQ